MDELTINQRIWGGTSQEIRALGEAYLSLVRMPFGVIRARNQEALSACLNALASELGMEPEVVQDFFEASSPHFRGGADIAANR